MFSGEWYLVDGVFNSESFVEHVLSSISCQLSLPLLSALQKYVRSLIAQESYFIWKCIIQPCVYLFNHISVCVKWVDTLVLTSYFVDFSGLLKLGCVRGEWTGCYNNLLCLGWGARVGQQKCCIVAFSSLFCIAKYL